MLLGVVLPCYDAVSEVFPEDRSGSARPLTHPTPLLLSVLPSRSSPFSEPSDPLALCGVDRRVVARCPSKRVCQVRRTHELPPSRPSDLLSVGIHRSLSLSCVRGVVVKRLSDRRGFLLLLLLRRRRRVCPLHSSPLPQSTTAACCCYPSHFPTLFRTVGDIVGHFLQVSKDKCGGTT